MFAASALLICWPGVRSPRGEAGEWRSPLLAVTYGLEEMGQAIGSPWCCRHCCGAGLSLNDGSLSLGAALARAEGGAPNTLLWRLLSTVLSLGALLTSPLQAHTHLDTAELAQCP